MPDNSFMYVFTLHLDGTPETACLALGAVSCTIVGSPEGKRVLNKGRMITDTDVAALALLGGVNIPLLMPEAGDVHEDDAAMRLGRAVAGDHISVLGPRESRARLVAARSGLFRVDAEGLRRVNAVEGLSIYTLFDRQPVKEGTVVAEAKVTPLLVSASILEEAEAAAVPPPLRVVPFKQGRVAALIRERLGQAQARRVVHGLSRKVAWFGSTLDEVRYVSPDRPAKEVANQMQQLLSEGIDLLLTSGSSVSDPFDPLLSALASVPATLDRIGVPAHPGSMLWIAHFGQVPILGVPSCGSFSEATAFDLVLPLIMAGEHLTSETIASLSEGGLLKPDDYRFPDYGAR